MTGVKADRKEERVSGLKDEERGREGEERGEGVCVCEERQMKEREPEMENFSEPKKTL